jgi:hypothetical protein
MPKFTPWPYLMRFDPKEAERRIREAYKQGSGMKTRAAVLLGVSERQLRRYCIMLGIHFDQDKVRGQARAAQLEKRGVTPPKSQEGGSHDVHEAREGAARGPKAT